MGASVINMGEPATPVDNAAFNPMSRTIRITVQLTVDDAQSGRKDVGELAVAWWKQQWSLTSFGGAAHCCEAEIVDVEEPKAKRHTRAFKDALEKKRAKVEAITGPFWPAEYR